MSLRFSSGHSRTSLEALAQVDLRAMQQARQQAALAATVKVVKPYIPHPPSERQSQFLALDCEEALFGGSAGGGKSVALLYDALAFIDVPGYVAGLFRLADEDWKGPDSLLTRANDWFAGTDAEWDAKLHSYRFPSGALVHFGSGSNGHLKTLKRAYQGIAFQFMGFDELGQWPEDCYRFLIGSRLRAGENKRTVPLRSRSTANPGGEEWVRERFIDGATSAAGTPYREDWDACEGRPELLPQPAVYESPPSPEAIEVAERFGRRAQGAFFVPSFLSDNPGFAGTRGEDYRMRMAQLDPVTRAQMEGGDWWINAQGKLFRKEWFQFIDEEPEGLEWWRCWDLAGTAATKPGDDPAYTAGVRVALWQHHGEPDRKRLVVSDLQHFREDPGGTELNVTATARVEGPNVRVLFEQEPGSAGKTVVHGYRTKLPGYTVEGFPKSGPKEEYWRVPSALAFNGDLVLVRGSWNKKLIDQLCGLPASKKKDIADALSIGAWKLLGYSRGERVRTKVRRPTRTGGLRGLDM